MTSTCRSIRSSNGPEILLRHLYTTAGPHTHSFSGWLWKRHDHGCVTSLTFSLEVPKPKPVGYPAALETLGDHVKAARLERELLQQQVADVIGVSTDTIQNWEAKRNEIKLMHIPAVTKFLGYCLVHYLPEGGWKQTLLNYRKQQGWNLVKMARTLNVDERSLSKIERSGKLSRRLEEKIREKFSAKL